MNLWQQFEIEKNSTFENAKIIFHYENGIEKELKEKFMAFSRWLRKKYIFPVNLNVYILNCETIKLLNGNKAYGSFRWFPKLSPRIRVPAAIEVHLLNEFTKEEIYEQILSSLVHELTHYYQWVLDLDQNDVTSERQANYYRYRIIKKFNKGN